MTVLALCYETPLLRYAMRHLGEAARDCVGACGLLASCVLAPGLVHVQWVRASGKGVGALVKRLVYCRFVGV